MNLQENQKSRIKEVFQAVYEASQNAKQYNDSAKDMKGALAKELDVKGEVISSAYGLWVKSIEKPEIIEQTDQILEHIK